MLHAMLHHGGGALLAAAAPVLPHLVRAASRAGAAAAGTCAPPRSSGAVAYGSAAWAGGPFGSPTAGGEGHGAGDPSTQHERAAVSAFVQEVSAGQRVRRLPQTSRGTTAARLVPEHWVIRMMRPLLNLCLPPLRRPRTSSTCPPRG